MSMRYASKNSQMRNVRLSYTPYFLQCLFPNTSHWRLIRQVDHTCHNFRPKFLGQFLAVEHAPSYVEDSLVLSFCHAILLGGSRNYQGLTNSIYFAELLKLLEVNSPPLSDLMTLIFLHCSFELLEDLKNFWLLLQEIHPCFLWKIIYKDKEIITITEIP